MNGIVSKIETGDYEIVSYGVILLPEKSVPIKFHVDDVTIELIYKNDKNASEEDQNMEIETTSEKHISIICTNWNLAPMGIGPKDLMPVLKLDDGKIVYFKFVSYELANLPYIIYTFYTKMENRNNASIDN